MQKSAKVEIRVTPEEKARWAEVAGGPRKVSAWLRSLANVAAANEPLLHDPVVSATQEALAPDAPKRYPARALDVIGVAPEAETGKVSLGMTNGVHLRETCPRSHFHRQGVYCGTCGKLI